jgi:hypothetical protein
MPPGVAVLHYPERGDRHEFPLLEGDDLNEMVSFESRGVHSSLTIGTVSSTTQKPAARQGGVVARCKGLVERVAARNDLPVLAVLRWSVLGPDCHGARRHVEFSARKARRRLRRN